MQKALRFSFMASATVLLLGVAGGAQAQQAPNMTFFVTSTPIGKGGDLGGLAGADAHCQQLATTVGAGGKTWRAYLSSPETPTAKGINARDRIGNGPWQNSKGAVIAQNPDDLHSANNKLTRDTALTERGAIVAGVGYTPVWHDALTGSDREGRAFPGNINILQQLVEQRIRQGDARSYRSHRPRRQRLRAFVEFLASIARLQPGRPDRHRRHGAAVLLRAVTTFASTSQYRE